jgi:hypothetical protein
MAWGREDRAKADTVLQAAVAALKGLAEEEKTRNVASLALALASPDMRAGWPYAMEKLLQGQSEDLARVFLPVAEVLRTGNPARLDVLPPEQREFALEVLKKFEPERSGEPDKPSNGDRAPES